MSVTITGLCRRYDALTALDNIDLSVGDDELLVVLGPTGAGKTTLLRIIAGLERPDSGTLLLHGRNAVTLSPAERDVALVFQNFSIYPDWSVRENLAFPLRAPGRRLDEQEITRRIAWAAALLRLETMLDRPANRLSGGQLQRVAIGRAIVRRPSLFLMDEPLTNLDAKLREQLRVELAVLRRELKIPMIYVTHDQAEALSMGDRIAVLDRGQLRQVGTPETIYENPVSPLVARQLGQPAINLVPVHCLDDWWTSAEGLRLIPRTAAHPEHTALVGIRSEHITLTGGNDSAQITQIESAGPVVLVSILWRQQPFQATAPATCRFNRGDTVHPTIDAQRALVWAR